MDTAGTQSMVQYIILQFRVLTKYYTSKVKGRRLQSLSRTESQAMFMNVVLGIFPFEGTSSKYTVS